jgi:hypothetical protein
MVGTVLNPMSVHQLFCEPTSREATKVMSPAVGTALDQEATENLREFFGILLAWDEEDWRQEGHCVRRSEAGEQRVQLPGAAEPMQGRSEQA